MYTETTGARRPHAPGATRTDATGKASFDHIYTEPDPRAYFTTLRALDYQIPQAAKPHFAALLQQYREVSGVASPTVLDIGCSYGINAALLRCDVTMEQLYERYCDRDFYTHDSLLARDRAFVRAHDHSGGARYLGLDASDSALSYAVDAGFIDAAIHADLEAGDPTEPQRAQLAEADLVISTGCIGYVTERTIARIVQAHGGRRPWMAHFVLRMFPFDPIADTLAAAGYDTVRHEGVFKQRRFAGPDEQAQVLDALHGAAVDPSGLESEGWLYAQLYLSRPHHPERGPQ
ncbi:class I SAM-dependent methyltransferase [Actinomadura rupiterrae]|uniref:class I SAM-dependent methyltransferase n=1 Tax=Actinomadura rupiterrae TaxID=559627 RepID=UPI0020A3844C|nr:class I SAM-dependent methyltransferase [Actinomadura rupiterrae]MCP2341506.1 SAM-dependent methyltransferase [Actinomadura rupiterrae]